jgi:SWI/SNF related-matrix-associated actin-dependent regulator of chromatin subfamily C
MDHGLLNCGQIGETAPGNSVLRGLHAAGGSLAGSKRKHSTAITWTTDRLRALEASVVKHVSKKTVEGSPDQVSLVVDWNAVAADVGGGATALDCQGGFVHSPVEDVKISVSSKNSVVSNILNGAHPDVLKTVVEASLQSTGDINEARNASFVAVMASAAAQRGAHVESEIENTLMDIVDQRIQRLENRVALLDDVAALLEAERVSLELERRDMYTARCRHWFGDGSL